MAQKRALITGITGQDGSYLAEFLLLKNYKVYGLTRRTSTPNLERIKHLEDKIELIPGDLLDQQSLTSAVAIAKPDEIYNLAAQSFVAASWSQPVLTGEFTALGVTRMLEAVRQVKPDTKFYQASSSEMFGKGKQTPQNEKTPFHPRSPYGVAKVYGHWITINYRESYGIFTVSGILFNHECVTAQTPVIIRENGFIDVVPIEEIVPHREKPRHGIKYTTDVPKTFEVWDGDTWTKVKTLTATWNSKKSKVNTYKKVRQVICRGGYYEATEDHVSFLEGAKEIRTDDLKKNDRLELKSLPPLTLKTTMSHQEAEFLGMMVADGYVADDGRGRFINNNKELRNKIKKLWDEIAAGSSHETTHPSGFNKGADVGSVEFSGNVSYLRYIHDEIYTEKLFKRIPKRILNSSRDIITAFLKGYNSCDGLKGGHQKTEFKSFTTNSQTLALGLWYLINTALNLRLTIHPEFRKDKVYFHLNINSDKKTQSGKHLARELNEVKDVKDYDYKGWLFDLETESKTFSAGIGLTWIHNSPRRGLEFVTRKISHGVARIHLGQADHIVLGNLEAKRDWGFAGDYVQAMWMMLQQEKPDDYVIATGENHSVAEFCEEAFKVIGATNWKKYVKVDRRLFRPAEVDFLIGDASKAHRVLGWKPQVDFRALVKMMVEADIELLSKNSR